jgi:phosphoribosylanthranilate isomerase
MTLVKICGMTDIEAVRAAVAAGADAIGFVFAASVRRIRPQDAKDMAADIPHDIRKVAVMLHPLEDEWLEVREVFQPDVLQTDAADFRQLDVPPSIEKWPVLREGEAGLQGELPGTFVYEGKVSGRGRKVDWQKAAVLSPRGHMILAGGLSVANVARAIREVRPWGVDVSSAVESQPGRKDAGRIRAFIEAARNA